MRKSQKIVWAIVIALLMIIIIVFAGLQCSANAVETQQSNSTTFTETQQPSLPDYSKLKSKRIKTINTKYTKWKKYMSKSQKNKIKTYKSKVKKAKKKTTINKYYKKSITLINKVKKEHSYGENYVQVSCYGPYEGECITATSRRITNSTPYIAVPIGDIVSKSTWQKMSYANKMKHFYYHEKIYLKKGNKTCVAYVEDCGGFGRYGTTYNGRYCKRQFDLTPAVFHALGVSGTGIVRWHY